MQNDRRDSLVRVYTASLVIPVHISTFNFGSTILKSQEKILPGQEMWQIYSSMARMSDWLLNYQLERIQVISKEGGGGNKANAPFLPDLPLSCVVNHSQ